MLDLIEDCSLLKSLKHSFLVSSKYLTATNFFVDFNLIILFAAGDDLVKRNAFNEVTMLSDFFFPPPVKMFEKIKSL